MSETGSTAYTGHTQDGFITNGLFDGASFTIYAKSGPPFIGSNMPTFAATQITYDGWHFGGTGVEAGAVPLSIKSQFISSMARNGKSGFLLETGPIWGDNSNKINKLYVGGGDYSQLLSENRALMSVKAETDGTFKFSQVSFGNTIYSGDNSFSGKVPD